MSDKAQLHTLTVKEVAKMFEKEGVAKTERTLLRWCEKDKTGGARLNCQLDQNEHKYFITPESVYRAIEEEQAKQKEPIKQDDIEDNNQRPTQSDIGSKSSPTGSDTEPGQRPTASDSDGNNLKWKIRELELTNQADQRYIDKLEEITRGKDSAYQMLVQELKASAYQIGLYESRLMQLAGPKEVEEVKRIIKEESAEEQRPVAEEAIEVKPTETSEPGQATSEENNTSPEPEIIEQPPAEPSPSVEEEQAKQESNEVKPEPETL